MTRKWELSFHGIYVQYYSDRQRTDECLRPSIKRSELYDPRLVNDSEKNAKLVQFVFSVLDRDQFLISRSKSISQGSNGWKKTRKTNR